MEENLSSNSSPQLSPSTPAPVTVELCKNGDAALIVSKKRFVVLSGLLRNVSDCFETLFSEALKEGKRDANGNYPDIVLHEDDPDAMEIMLSVLHHRSDKSFDKLAAKRFGEVAKHCDKYQCATPFHHVATHWFYHIPTHQRVSVKALAKLVYATHIFGMNEIFRLVSKELILNLPLDFHLHPTPDWLQLPQEMQDDITLQMTVMTSKLQEAWEFECIKMQEKASTPDRCSLSCGGARGAHNNEFMNKRRRVCHERPCHEEMCECFETLGMWPTSVAFGKFSANAFLSQFDAAFELLEEHEPMYCRAKADLYPMQTDLKSLVYDKITGLQAI